MLPNIRSDKQLSTTGGVTATNYNLTIGACPDTGRGSEAEFASVRVYSKALSASDLQSQNTASPAYQAKDDAVALWLDFSAQPEEPQKTKLRGDVTEDGVVDVKDAVLLARVVANDKEADITDQGKINADVKEDGLVDKDDLSTLLRILARAEE